MIHHKTFPSRLRAIALLIGVLFILNTAVIADAQSGRRIPKRPPASDETSDTTAPKTGEPPVNQPAETKSGKPGTPITIAKHLDDIVYSSDIYLNVVMSGFLDRMSEIKTIKATPAGGDLNRKQAQDAAKASEDRYVVWFQLVAERNSTAYNTPSDASTLYVDYTVYLPGTGKAKTSGHIYQRSRSAGGVSVPVPGGGYSIEYALRNAGIELAERVLNTLDLLTTTTPPTH